MVPKLLLLVNSYLLIVISFVVISVNINAPVPTPVDSVRTGSMVYPGVEPRCSVSYVVIVLLNISFVGMLLQSATQAAARQTARPQPAKKNGMYYSMVVTGMVMCYPLYGIVFIMVVNMEKHKTLQLMQTP